MLTKMPAQVVASIAVIIIYRVWFHPLSVFPGPKRLAITEAPQQWQNCVQGTWVRKAGALHRQYGPIVRIGPNHLAVDGSIGWPQIFGHRPGQAEFSKYPSFFGDHNNITVIGAPRESHRRQRRQLAHAFSEAALTEQQDIMLHYMDLLMDKFSEHAGKGEKTNIVNWLNFMAFDIIGDLTFGESFGSLTKSDYHPWVRNIVEGVRSGALARFVLYQPLFAPIFPFLVGRSFFKALKESTELSNAKAKARIAQGEVDGRRDFMTYLTKKTRDGEQGMTYEEQVLNSPILIAAGSETTATALSGFFFFMGHRRDFVQILTEEVRGAFQTENEITAKAAAKLPFLVACLEETLRLYPPAIETPPRVSPGAEINGTFVPKGVSGSNMSNQP